MSSKFLKINNKLIQGQNEHGINMFKLIGTEGFTLYCYLLYMQGSNDTCSVSIKSIQGFLSREYNNRPILNYKNKVCKISTLKSKQTILIYLQDLLKQKLIKIHNSNDIKNKYKIINKVNINETLIISCKEISKDKYSLMPNDLYLDYIYKIGHIGWSLLCVLSNLHNEIQGFANPSEEYLSRTICKGLTTIKVYLKLLKKLKLIKIEIQDNIYIETSHGTEVTYTPNHYTVEWNIKNKFAIIDKREYSLEELRMMPYKEYLKTDHWKKIRLKKLKQAHYKCQLCGLTEQLNVHHNTYENRGCEKDEDLIVLCYNCHSKFHNKEDSISEQ